ncbi:MAG: tRNA (adenosine(37)-N6)-threonylcarbamoyltransferase complex ATPase subunit type 1 TsaE [Acidiferrobacterales bacterium]|nr:tRNA (adenosine(37)-N6)-threonylcarbamoyltransferase complex ATPase subunit type 1 TsaE [Acidiferrobacterales bacterium]
MPEVFPASSVTLRSHSLVETDQIGRQLAAEFVPPCCIYLQGDLGAGKTTLCKTIIQNLGYQGVVTSPTYNLIQEYPIANATIYHMDLYRLNSAAELEFLAITDLWTQDSLFLIEWPSNGQGYLPAATHRIDIKNIENSASIRDICIAKF